MESSIAVFLKWLLACELQPTLSHSMMNVQSQGVLTHPHTCVGCSGLCAAKHPHTYKLLVTAGATTPAASVVKTLQTL